MRKFLILSLLGLSTLFLSAQETPRWGKWSRFGDNGDGTYSNPVLPMDFSDIDCIRVGDDYYAIASTFQFSPGVTLLHSRDLVNWEYCCNIVQDITSISPGMGYGRMDHYGRGIWAGSLRYHDGMFHLFFGTPDEGYFCTSSPAPEGPWEPLTCLMAGPGWDDCSAIWDEYGKAYFVGTCFSEGYKTYIFDMSPDGKSIDRSSARLINSDMGREANKLIRHGRWYYLVYSEYDGTARYVMARRARKVEGPYSEPKRLSLHNRAEREPNQGGIIQGKNGRWYFLTHHGSLDWSGRLVSLLPVRWKHGWPIIGDKGRMVWDGAMPGKEENLRLAADEGFESIGPQWQWNCQPREDMYSLVERPGWLRLKAFVPLKPVMEGAGNTLVQRIRRVPESVVTLKMDTGGMAIGQKAGLCHLSAKSSVIEAAVTDEGMRIQVENADSVVCSAPLASGELWLRSEWDSDGNNRFFYSTDGISYEAFGPAHRLSAGHYTGDRIGVFCYNTVREEGYADFDFISYSTSPNP